MKQFYPNQETKTFGIIGFPLSHTLSPLLHNYIYRKMRLNALYKVFSVEKPEKTEILNLHKYGLYGLSVTIPHKEWAYKIADWVDGSAEKMKSANTLILQDGRILAYNTDGLGAIQAIQKKDSKLIEPNRLGDILILGSGGSARGIGFAILEEWKKTLSSIASETDNHQGKKQIILSARNPEKSQELLQEMNSFLPGSTLFIPLEEMIQSQPQYIDLVIQTTSVGMKGKEQISILPPLFLHKGMTVFDIVYNPTQTKLVQMAKKKKSKIIPGIDMLIYQGLEQIRLFTGEIPPQKMVAQVRKKMLRNLEK